MTHEERFARIERILQQVQDQMHETNTNLKQTHDAVVTEVVKLVKDLEAKWKPSNPVTERQEPKVPILTRMGVEEVPLSEAIKAQRDWEVLEFGDKSYLFKLHSAGWYTTDQTPYQHNFTTLIAREPIHRVRRLSDGVEFSVGQAVTNAQTGLSGRIDKFEIGWLPHTKDKLLVYFTDSKNRECDKFIENIFPAESIFATADGVCMYEGDTVWCHFPDGHVSEHKANRHKKSHQWYSTREAALAAYKKWLYGQRVLSVDDVLELDGDIDKLLAVAKGRVSK